MQESVLNTSKLFIHRVNVNLQNQKCEFMINLQSYLKVNRLSHSFKLDKLLDKASQTVSSRIKAAYRVHCWCKRRVIVNFQLKLREISIVSQLANLISSRHFGLFWNVQINFRSEGLMTTTFIGPLKFTFY